MHSHTAIGVLAEHREVSFKFPQLLKLGLIFNFVGITSIDAFYDFALAFSILLELDELISRHFHSLESNVESDQVAQKYKCG